MPACDALSFVVEQLKQHKVVNSADVQLIKIAGLEARKVLSQEFYADIKEELQLPIDYANWSYYL